MKAFADDKINATEKSKFDLESLENIVGKGENAGYQHFLLFPQCFQKASDTGSLKVGIVWYRVKTQHGVTKSLVGTANGFVAEEKRKKHAEFGYPVTEFISFDARDSSNQSVEHTSHIITLHQMGVSVRFVW